MFVKGRESKKRARKSSVDARDVPLRALDHGRDVRGQVGEGAKDCEERDEDDRVCFGGE